MFAQATTIKLSLAIQPTISESVIVDEEDQNFYEKIVNKSYSNLVEFYVPCHPCRLVLEQQNLYQKKTSTSDTKTDYFESDNCGESNLPVPTINNVSSQDIHTNQQKRRFARTSNRSECTINNTKLS